MTAEVVDLSGLHAEVYKGMNRLWQEYYPFTELPKQLPVERAKVLLDRLEKAPDNSKYFRRARTGVLDSLRALLQGCGLT